ncbi:MAG: hypothetical protein KJ047_10190 [Anaerolineae bacterium]|nr:hypothetical protein [Anaerolineae bacterium]
MPESPRAGLPRRPPDLDEMPVEELIRLSRALTRRITDQDRQRLTLALRESGDARRLWAGAPAMLQQFFAGEIDLDDDLARRFANAPLLAHLRLVPEAGEPLRRQATAILGSNDDVATLTVDAALDETAALVFTFTLFGTLALRFHLSPLLEPDRLRWMELLRRDSGITMLWTRERWEQPYLILVTREGFGRLYAFSPHGIEAAVRLTPDMIAGLVDWLKALWFPERSLPDPQPAPGERRAGRRTPPEAQDRRRSLLHTAIPDAPEEQWAPDSGEWDVPSDALDW